MGSRKGNVILFTQLKNQLYTRLESEFLGKYRGEWTDDELEAALHALALATMRYGMLVPENNSQIVFDLDEWTARSGNTGPYLMYAYARTRSILRELHSRAAKITLDASLLSEPAEHELLVKISLFEETVKGAAAGFSPSTLCSYLFELSKSFNRFYASCPVKAADSDELMRARLQLVELTGEVIARGFELIGVPVIERM
jgi:arginyl-tRNA synthetase